MATTAGGSAGGSGGGLPPRKPEPPANIPDDAEDEEVEDEEVGIHGSDNSSPPGRRVQCLVCQRWILRSVGLGRHAGKCVGPRHFSGNFACVSPGCHVRRSYFHDLTKHWRKAHEGPIPAAIRAYIP